MNMSFVRTVPIILFIFSACTNTSKPTEKAGKATPVIQQTAESQSKDLFLNKCAVCHGTDGTAGINNAANLQKSVLDSGSLTQLILKGKGAMPGFKNQLSEKEIRNIVGYVRSLRK
jgi:mono/diheme cytochrome c family protein